MRQERGHFAWFEMLHYVDAHDEVVGRRRNRAQIRYRRVVPMPARQSWRAKFFDEPALSRSVVEDAGGIGDAHPGLDEPPHADRGISVYPRLMEALILPDVLCAHRATGPVSAGLL